MSEDYPDITQETAPVLPGFEMKPPKPGEPGLVEAGVRQQIEKLQQDGWLTGHHAGQVALAIRTASDVDKSEGRGAPSGRANLLRVMREILELLPQPEADTGDSFDRALAAIMGAVPIEEPQA